MSLSSLVGRTVALCGTFDSDVRSLLVAAGVRVVPWSPRLDVLLCGGGTEHKDHIKYKTAIESGISIAEWGTFITNVPQHLWTDLYAPQALRDVIGHADVVKQLHGWLAGWSRGHHGHPRGALLSGPPGIGKTTLAHIVCRAAGYEVIEMNASDCRSASQIKASFETAVRSGVVGGRRVVIMDEVDGMSSGDRGGVGELAAILRITSFPIICIANERSAPKLRPIVNTCLDLKCARPSKTVIAKAIYERIVKPRRLTIDLDELERMCEFSGNDIRQIVNSLQFDALGTAGSTAGGRKDTIHRMDPFSAAGLLFKSPPTADVDTRMNYVYLDHGLVPLMVAEGYVAAAGRGAGLDGAVRSAQALEMYDIIDTRIHKTQAWSLLPAAVLGVVEAAGAARGPAPFQIFPQWLGKSSKARKHRRWMAELARRLGTVAGNVFDMRETLRARLFRLKDAPAIVDALLELGITRDDMFEVLAETVFTGDEASIAMDTKLKGAVTREWKKRGVEDTATLASTEEDDDDDLSEETDGAI